jgi:predicted transcriptional regulator
MPVKELTKAEETVMQLLWLLKEALVKDIIELMPDPKPAYNTVSTVVRVLESKGFIDHKPHGNSHIYFPLISAARYRKFTFDKLMSNYFSNSYKSLLSFIANEKKLDIQQLDELTQLAVCDGKTPFKMVAGFSRPATVIKPTGIKKQVSHCFILLQLRKSF